MDDAGTSTDRAVAPKLRIYTVGHSNHTFEAFLGILRLHDIELLVDVRSSPYSRYVSQANRETLFRALQANRIEYRWLGDRLGGKPDGAVAGYDELAASPFFAQGIHDLLGLAKSRVTVIMCSEGDHQACHRHKLITPALVDKGVEVIHIQPDGTALTEQEQPVQLALF